MKIIKSRSDTRKIPLKFKRKCQKIGKTDDVELFKRALEFDLVAEKNIAHSKVREYWLLRGPRMFILTFIYIV